MHVDNDGDGDGDDTIASTQKLYLALTRWQQQQQLNRREVHSCDDKVAPMQPPTLKISLLPFKDLCVVSGIIIHFFVAINCDTN